jgi:HTH-type transcriptional regulator / antitoxin HigA
MAAEVRPIRTKRDYEAALKVVERLWGAKTGTRDGDRLDVLATLIDAYEAEHYPIDPPDPIEAIKFRMEQQGLTRRDLEEIIGTRTRIAEVMNRKRGLQSSRILRQPARRTARRTRTARAPGVGLRKRPGKKQLAPSHPYNVMARSCRPRK